MLRALIILPFCLLCFNLLLVGCGDKESFIDRPEDQGYNDPGLRIRDSIEVDGMIDGAIVEGVWSHESTTTGSGDIKVDANDERQFEAVVEIAGDGNGWENGSIDLVLDYQATDKFDNVSNETVMAKEN